MEVSGFKAEHAVLQRAHPSCSRLLADAPEGVLEDAFVGKIGILNTIQQDVVL